MPPSRPAKKWCFTLNNYTDAQIQLLSTTECAHIVYGKETGESGTPHLQGYINFRTAHRLSSVKNILPTAHWEICIAYEHAIIYCKKDGDIYERDSRVQGKRTDWDTIRNMAIDGKFASIVKEYPGQWARYHRGIRSFRDAADEPSGYDFPKEVHVRWGAPGTGKTRFFFDKYKGDLHSMQCHGGYFTRYGGQRVVLFDDFDGAWVKRGTLLQLLDRYPTTVNVKGSYAQWFPEVICITSNTDPREWYNHAPEAVMRRLTTVTKCSVMEVIDG